MSTNNSSPPPPPIFVPAASRSRLGGRDPCDWGLQMKKNHLPPKILARPYGLCDALNFTQSFSRLTERHRLAHSGIPNSAVWYYKYPLLPVGCAICTCNTQNAHRAEYGIYDCISRLLPEFRVVKVEPLQRKH